LPLKCDTKIDTVIRVKYFIYEKPKMFNVIKKKEADFK